MVDLFSPTNLVNALDSTNYEKSEESKKITEKRTISSPISNSVKTG